METSNVKALWEALAEIRLLLVRVPLSIKPDIACGIINSKAKHALSTPPRNCDVGTAEEQHARYDKFCNTQKHCQECPCYSVRSCESGCALNWAQLPYKNEVEQ